MNSWLTLPEAAQCSTMAMTDSWNSFPFSAQLSMLTKASGAAPWLKRCHAPAAAMDMMCEGLSGPAARSASTAGLSMP